MKKMFSFLLSFAGSKVLLPFAVVCVALFCSCDNSVVEGGALPAAFSVSADKQVLFSQGNLQYQATTGTWRFADHQYDMVGMGCGNTDAGSSCYVAGNVPDSDNRKIGADYAGWIDLFAWGTGDTPVKNNTDKEDYPVFTDWGVNTITNGGDKKWRTLNYDEWDYLLNDRVDAMLKYGVAEVAGVAGLVLLPDDWTLPKGLVFMFGMAGKYDYTAYKTVNQYTAAEWQKMEKNGAVFLPAAGSREGTSVDMVGVSGYYWSSTDVNLNDAHYWYFYSSVVDSYYSPRYFGYSVRLCSEL